MDKLQRIEQSTAFLTDLNTSD